MKTWLFILTAVFLVTGVLYAKDYEVTKKAGEYNVKIKMDKNPPVAGKNNVEISITDSAGKAVTDTKVVIQYTMPAMPGMPAMNYKAEAELKGNVYVATVNYSMAGPWSNEIKITKDNKTVTARYTVDVK